MDNSSKLGLYFTLFLITLPVHGQNFNCDGKAFHCVNSTHFKICVDLGGGVSKTVDDFIIPCPSETFCKKSNQYECEYELNTPMQVREQSKVTTEATTLDVILNDVMGIIPLSNNNKSELSDTYNISTTTEYSTEMTNTATSKSALPSTTIISSESLGITENQIIDRVPNDLTKSKENEYRSTTVSMNDVSVLTKKPSENSISFPTVNNKTQILENTIQNTSFPLLDSNSSIATVKPSNIITLLRENVYNSTTANVNKNISSVFANVENVNNNQSVLSTTSDYELQTENIYSLLISTENEFRATTDSTNDANILTENPNEVLIPFTEVTTDTEKLEIMNNNAPSPVLLNVSNITPVYQSNDISVPLSENDYNPTTADVNKNMSSFFASGNKELSIENINNNNSIHFASSDYKLQTDDIYGLTKSTENEYQTATTSTSDVRVLTESPIKITTLLSVVNNDTQKIKNANKNMSPISLINNFNVTTKIPSNDFVDVLRENDYSAKTTNVNNSSVFVSDDNKFSLKYKNKSSLTAASNDFKPAIETLTKNEASSLLVNDYILTTENVITDEPSFQEANNFNLTKGSSNLTSKPFPTVYDTNTTPENVAVNVITYLTQYNNTQNTLTKLSNMYNLKEIKNETTTTAEPKDNIDIKTAVNVNYNLATQKSTLHSPVANNLNITKNTKDNASLRVFNKTAPNSIITENNSLNFSISYGTSNTPSSHISIDFITDTPENINNNTQPLSVETMPISEVTNNNFYTTENTLYSEVVNNYNYTTEQYSASSFPAKNPTNLIQNNNITWLPSAGENTGFLQSNARTSNFSQTKNVSSDWEEDKTTKQPKVITENMSFSLVNKNLTENTPKITDLNKFNSNLTANSLLTQDNMKPLHDNDMSLSLGSVNHFNNNLKISTSTYSYSPETHNFTNIPKNTNVSITSSSSFVTIDDDNVTSVNYTLSSADVNNVTSTLAFTTLHSEGSEVTSERNKLQLPYKINDGLNLTKNYTFNKNELLTSVKPNSYFGNKPKSNLNFTTVTEFTIDEKFRQLLPYNRSLSTDEIDIDHVADNNVTNTNNFNKVVVSLAEGPLTISHNQIQLQPTAITTPMYDSLVKINNEKYFTPIFKKDANYSTVTSSLDEVEAFTSQTIPTKKNELLLDSPHGIIVRENASKPISRIYYSDYNVNDVTTLSNFESEFMNAYDKKSTIGISLHTNTKVKNDELKITSDYTKTKMDITSKSIDGVEYINKNVRLNEETIVATTSATLKNKQNMNGLPENVDKTQIESLPLNDQMYTDADAETISPELSSSFVYRLSQMVTTIPVDIFDSKYSLHTTGSTVSTNLQSNLKIHHLLSEAESTTQQAKSFDVHLKTKSNENNKEFSAKQSQPELPKMESIKVKNSSVARVHKDDKLSIVKLETEKQTNKSTGDFIKSSNCNAVANLNYSQILNIKGPNTYKLSNKSVLPNNTFCLNHSNGKYSDQNNCSKFYICLGKLQPLIGQCPPNTVFSDIRKLCTKDLSHCIRDNQFKCSANGRYYDVFLKNTYYICVWNKHRFIKFKFQCQKGYSLNKTIIRCMPDEKRANSSASENDSSGNKDGSTSKEESSKVKNVFKCVREGKFGDPENCNKYFVCTKNNKSEFRRKVESCDRDEVWHKEKNKCVDDDSYECKVNN